MIDRRRKLQALVAVLTMLVACGSPAAPVATTKGIQTDPHASRDALVRETFARLGAGNVDELAALVPHKAGLDRVITCDRPDRVDEDQAARRDVLRETAKNFKGQTFEVLAISKSAQDEVSTQPVGEAFIEGCTLSVPVRWEPLEVKVRVSAASSAPRESSVWMNVYEIAGRWYLVVMQEKP